ncbi:MAG: hypothetical protein Q7W05_08630, partial [Deltaproteobacteria bacterium]|nr:hypothetical protein [Deltaproteobacteria bacterium]
MSKIYAPFTPEQVQILNEVQANSRGEMPKFHPFTCPSRGNADHAPANSDTDLLVATEKGWVCPFCDYEQNWAYAVMASPTARIVPEFLLDTFDTEIGQGESFAHWRNHTGTVAAAAIEQRRNILGFPTANELREQI